VLSAFLFEQGNDFRRLGAGAVQHEGLYIRRGKETFAICAEIMVFFEIWIACFMQNKANFWTLGPYLWPTLPFLFGGQERSLWTSPFQAGEKKVPDPLRKKQAKVSVDPLGKM